MIAAVEKERAMIAKIPEPIAQFVGRSFWPADAGR